MLETFHEVGHLNLCQGNLGFSGEGILGTNKSKQTDKPSAHVL